MNLGGGGGVGGDDGVWVLVGYRNYSVSFAVMTGQQAEEVFSAEGGAASYTNSYGLGGFFCGWAGCRARQGRGWALLGLLGLARLG